MAQNNIKKTTASENTTKTTEKSQSAKPIRESLVKNGVKNERIGWNNETSNVTIDGKDVYKPSVNIDGTTYADDSDIQAMTRQAYSMAGDDLVAARDYVTSKGYSGIVNWDGENALIGGEVIKPAYVENGISFIPRSVVDNAIYITEERNGIMSSDEIDRLYNRKYGYAIEDALEAVLDRDAFSYDPDNDVAYQAYRDQYLREAEDAFRRVLNDNNTSVTGASGAVLSEAMYMRDNAIRQLTDKIPELVEDAYERYSDETQRLYDDLDKLYEMGEDYYNRLYTRDQNARKAVTDAGAAEREENQRIITNNRNREQDYYDFLLSQIEIDKGNIDLQYYNDNLAADYEGKILDNKISELEYESDQLDYALKELEYEMKRAEYEGRVWW